MTHADDLKPADLRSERLEELYDYWHGLAERLGRPISRADIDPTDIAPGLLPIIKLVDVVWDSDAPDAYVFRLVGTELANKYGDDFTGRTLAQADLREQEAEIRADFNRCRDLQRPVYAENRSRSRRGVEWTFRRLLLPLIQDGRVTMILGGVDVDIARDDGLPRAERPRALAMERQALAET